MRCCVRDLHFVTVLSLMVAGGILGCGATKRSSIYSRLPSYRDLEESVQRAVPRRRDGHAKGELTSVINMWEGRFGRREAHLRQLVELSGVRDDKPLVLVEWGRNEHSVLLIMGSGRMAGSYVTDESSAFHVTGHLLPENIEEIRSLAEKDKLASYVDALTWDGDACFVTVWRDGEMQTYCAYAPPLTPLTSDDTEWRKEDLRANAALILLIRTVLWCGSVQWATSPPFYDDVEER